MQRQSCLHNDASFSLQCTHVLKVSKHIIGYSNYQHFKCDLHNMLYSSF